MVNNQVLTREHTSFGLEQLLAPIDLAEFYSRYWEQEPLLIHRGEPAYFRQLFSIDDVDRVLDFHRPGGATIRVVKNQEPLLPSKYENHDGTLNLNQLYAAYADGYTVVINGIDRYWASLRTLCQRMSQTLSHHTIANMYLTPRHEKALLPHYDTHDVFVIQVHGKKHWKIYDTEVESPLLHSFQPIFQREQLRNVRDITLEAGDIMYMPRGVPHEAFTTDALSLHLTVGVHPAQWVDLLTQAVKQLAMSHVALRKAVPPGFLQPSQWTAAFQEQMQQQFAQLMETVAREASVHGGVHLLAETFRSEHLPMGDGHFRQIDQSQDLGTDTYVEKRQGVLCTAQLLGNSARIVYPGNSIKGPVHLAGAFQFIAEAEGRFQIADIPGLADDGKTKLAARLVRGGLLRIAD